MRTFLRAVSVAALMALLGGCADYYGVGYSTTYPYSSFFPTLTAMPGTATISPLLTDMPVTRIAMALSAAAGGGATTGATIGMVAGTTTGAALATGTAVPGADAAEDGATARVMVAVVMAEDTAAVGTESTAARAELAPSHNRKFERTSASA